MAARRTTRTSVGYVGYTFGGNLGDDACLRAARALLPSVAMTDWCRAWPHGMRERLTFDSTMVGGGTLVGRSGFLAEFESMARRNQGPTFALGVGVEDPLSAEWGLTNSEIAAR